VTTRSVARRAMRRACGDPGLGEGLRFGERRDGEAGRPVRQLPARQLHAFVRLGVRPQGHTEPAGALGHAAEIALHHVQVEQQRRRLEVGGDLPRPPG